MSVFKCKMCGGTIEFEPGATVGECDSCGSRQTLPRLDSEKKTNLYDRASHFRQNNDFDKAMAIYDQILNEDNTDAEAYWSLVLCRYGIEYVEDPASHKRMPTINRAQFTSILVDDDYKSAIRYADGYQKIIYEDEAHAIDEIQKGILAISQKEEPFDVFICYKETDANGRRTQDSVLATDLYYQLTQEGFKVFFARITLEDKLGTAYEPYIFAALNSAKVMVVLGTKPEYFNAVWVKNEWSRFLSLIKNGSKKTLIPAYRDMDPYALPEEFSYLQSQDMSRLGFMQDLIRGIRKILERETPKTEYLQAKKTVLAGGGITNVSPLLRRAFIFLEDGNWQEADEYCEKVLDQEPENAQAYLGKLMAEMKVHHQEDLQDCDKPFDGSNNYQRLLRYADSDLAMTINEYLTESKRKNETTRLRNQFDHAVKLMKTADSEKAFRKAAIEFDALHGYNEADSLATFCREKAKSFLPQAESFTHSAQTTYATYQTDVRSVETKYRESIDLMNRAFTEIMYKNAASQFTALQGYKDSDHLAKQCLEKAEISHKENLYKRAVDFMKRNDAYGYEQAMIMFKAIPGWRDADEKLVFCQKNYGEKKGKQNMNQKRAKVVKRVLLIIAAVWFAYLILVKIISCSLSLSSSAFILSIRNTNFVEIIDRDVSFFADYQRTSLFLLKPIQ